MCSEGREETCEHLFFSRPFAKEYWTKIGFTWDLSLDLDERLLQAKSRRRACARRSSGQDFFTEATIIATWSRFGR
jgi:hypothetical protein